MIDHEKLIFKVSGKKSYFKDFGGPFWYDALVDKKGKLIDIVSVEKKDNSDCYPIKELLNKSYIELPNSTQKEICVEK